MQGAILLALLTVVVAGLLGTIAIADRASDDTAREQTALLTWRFEAAQVDARGSVLAGELYLWNKAMLSRDPKAAQLQMTAAQSDISTIKALVSNMNALILPVDAIPVRSSYGDASLAFTDFASTFLAAGVHTDADVPTLVGPANTNRAAATAPVGPFIDVEVADNQAIQDARRTYVYQLIDFGGAISLGLLLILAFIVFRLILTPIVRLAGAASTLAAGRPAVIKLTTRRDEIGQLTAALAAWQQNSVSGLNDVSSRAAAAASNLSAVAEQLASATLEQTAAASATSASMDELARSSGSIADTIDRVAVQAGDVRTNLELAQSDLRASGDRTLALAGRINEIEGVLTLLNGIADQTNLLALNAAIEAARAGDAGRGFAVVADEVRRLAERSKAAAAQIATLVQGVQGQSSETVMALEKGVKQMERGLAMMLAMAEVSGQVRVATQQQRSSTEQVVRAIEHIAEGSRSVADTSREIALAASKQSELASELEQMSSNTAADPSAPPPSPGSFRRREPDGPGVLSVLPFDRGQDRLTEARSTASGANGHRND